MFYSSFGMLGLVIHVIINFDILANLKGTDHEDLRRKYRAFLFSAMVYFIVDILWGSLYEYGPTALVYTDTVLYFMSMVVTVLLWTRYVVAYLGDGSSIGPFLTLSGWIIFLFELVVLFVNFFSPIVFTFDEKGVYVPMPARYITLFLQILLFFGTSVYAFVVSAKTEGKDRYHHLAIGCSGIIMTAFIILQTLYPFLPFYAIGMLVGTCMIHTFVLADARADYNMKIGSARAMAYKDSLTGVRSSHAYKEAKDFLNKRIEEGTLEEFAVVVFDVNGLKIINDTYGHDAGDKTIKNASRLICDEFKHSPVFRIGGDEFVAFLESEDYRNRHALIDDFVSKIEENIRTGHVIVSCGIEEYHKGKDLSYETIFEQADRKMYENKTELKSRTHIR